MAADINSAIKAGDATALAAALAGADADGINKPDADGYAPLHVAALCGDQAALAAVLAAGADVDQGVRGGGLTALHLAALDGHRECVEALLRAGADVARRSLDMVSALGGMRFYTPGRAALHHAAGSGEAECVRLLLDNGADRTQRDCDGCTAAAIAALEGHDDVLALVDPSEREPRVDRDQAVRERARLDRARAARVAQAEQARRAAQRAELVAKYPRVHPNLELRPATDSGQPAEVRPGVWMLDAVLAAGAAAQLVQEVEAFQAWARANHLNVSPPNSMNRAGVVLDELGIGVDELVRDFIVPLARRLLPAVDLGDAPRVHGFVIQYAVGEDVSLAEHRDSSDVTLNLCLGGEFSGSKVFFEGADDVEHRPGAALLHRGDLLHGTRKLTAGARSNLVVWLSKT